jgi:hypothetical protein
MRLSLWFILGSVLMLTVPSHDALAQKGGGFGGGAMGGGGYVLRERMKRDRPTDFKILEKVKAAEIVVVAGQYDHAQTVLSYVKVPHITIEPEDLARAELNAGQLLLINCPGSLDRAAITKVRKFVNAGGFLFTTDWSLLNVLEKAFPGYVKFNQKPTNDDVVAVRVLKADHHFLQHVHSSKDTPKWWLEGSSYPIKVLDKGKVEVLMESDEMRRKYGEGPIAVTFKVGDGTVLHIISHYYLQRTETRTASEKAKGSDFAKELRVPLTPAAKKALDSTTAGEAKDAYSASQLSANIVVAKQKQNAQLEQVYRFRALADGILRASPSEKAGKVTAVKKGTKLKVLEKGSGWTKVQTYSGEVGWLKASEVNSK